MFNNKNTAVVLTDPQVEFLKPAGGGFSLTKDILEKYNTIENMIEMVKQAKEKGYKLFISPHYFYPSYSNELLNFSREHMMLEQQMFARKSQYESVEEGSGADFIEELNYSSVS
ncbi:hypothetical protein EfmAA290_04650 [Enterococcus faecium]|nr:hypothetical protein EfmAA290_04650 [Enterococcus faecium]